jgi:Domain of unknown function (DUF5655)
MAKAAPANTVAEHFEGRSAPLRKIYARIIATVRAFGPVIEDPKKTSIHLNRKTAFAGIKVQRDCIAVTIKADQEIASDRIVSSEQTSANRWHHVVKLFATNDVDTKLKEWLRRAYDLSS